MTLFAWNPLGSFNAKVPLACYNGTIETFPSFQIKLWRNNKNTKSQSYANEINVVVAGHPSYLVNIIRA